MTPGDRHFLVSFALGERAVPDHLSPRMLDVANADAGLSGESRSPITRASTRTFATVLPSDVHKRFRRVTTAKENSAVRTSLLVLFAGVTLAQAPAPENIVFARVFPQPAQLGLFIAAVDGSGERPLITPGDLDYNAVWAPDAASIVFTSERNGSADLYRVKPDGASLERLTDSSAYDDQAAFSPNGEQLVFVSSRAAGTADLWTLDLQTRRATPLTSGPGGDFRPSWSPDGGWIAFSSDRSSDLPFAFGRWEHLQLADLYIVHPDGSGLKQLSPHGGFCGSPKWTLDSRRLVAYCMTAEQTLDNRRAAPEHPEDTQIVSIDIGTGTMTPLPVGAGVKFNPSVLRGDVVAYLRKDGDERGVQYSDGRRGPAGDIRSAAWSPDGTRVVYHKRSALQRKPWVKIWSRDPAFEFALTTLLPSFHPAGDRFAFVTQGENAKGAKLMIAEVGSETSQLVYGEPERNVLGPQWSPDGKTIIFGIGVFNAFFNGFKGLFLKPGDRVDGGAQIAIVNPDGSSFRELTSGPNNNSFPSMSADGRRFVYRTFGPQGNGLRIMDIDTKQVTTIADGYDNFPLWSPRGDRIMFSRQDEGDYEIYTIKPDGTALKRVTHARGNDAHMAWSPDGEHIVFASSRMGFKDEMIYTDAPQPYGEIFVMRADGSEVRQLTDNQWEEGTPAWRPVSRPATLAQQHGKR
jgi:TolB protein